MSATSISHLNGGSWQSGRRPSLTSLGRCLLWLVFAFLAMATTVMPLPTYAAVDVRLNPRSIGEPIDAFVTVTDVSGAPVGGLMAADFLVSVDGLAVTGLSFSLPPTQDPNQKVSVVFAMDYSSSVQDAFLAPMQEAVIAFINAMRPGDYAAIVKFNYTNLSKASVVQPFTQIDGAAGTAALIKAVQEPYPGSGSNILDATVLSIQQVVSSPTALPSGPKAVVVVSDGGDNSSSVGFSSVVQSANAEKVSVFTVGVGDLSNASSQQLLTGLADQTGANFYPAPTDAQIGDAYLQVSQLLNNEYLLSFQSAITDCNSHTLEVQVKGQAQPAAKTFTRCTPKFVPDVRGLTQTAAQIELNKLGLSLGTITEQASLTVPNGIVISQDPTSAIAVLPGSKVNLVLSSGQPVVPNVVGKTESAAKLEITNAGLIVGTVTQEWNSKVPVGDVIDYKLSEPTAGDVRVDLLVSAGPLSGGGGGGGGGATGPFELLAGLLLVAALVMPRRRKV